LHVDPTDSIAEPVPTKHRKEHKGANSLKNARISSTRGELLKLELRYAALTLTLIAIGSLVLFAVLCRAVAESNEF